MDLANALRPTTFEEVIECPKAIEGLQGALPQALMLHGPTGCGKTTLAGLLANTLGEATETQEINASDLSGVDAARDLIRSTAFRPLSGGHRVVILEECHRMTGDAQNALLVPVEKAPEWMHWILCTTEPNKVMKTLRDRCLQIEVRELSPAGVVELVGRALEFLGDTRDLKKLHGQLMQMALFHPRGILRWIESGSLHEEGTVQVIDAVRAYYARDVRQLTEFFKQMTPREIASFSFVAASYGMKVFLSNPNPGTAKLVKAIAADIPYDETRGAAVIVTNALTALYADASVRK